MIDPIITAEFQGLQKRHDHQLGVLGGASNPREARVMFRRAMLAHGYTHAGLIVCGSSGYMCRTAAGQVGRRDR